MDGIEDRCVRYADLVAVNSHFTRAEVLRAFPEILTSPGGSRRDDDYLTVLHPPIDLTDFVPPDFDGEGRGGEGGDRSLGGGASLGPIVSLNRFERKKNVDVLIKAYARLVEEGQSVVLPPLVIAGGYDLRNSENAEYLDELTYLAAELGVAPLTTFRPSVSDSERADLLRSALCVAYTPDREHFGIVPLEAMYAGSPVVAIDSGGPRETVVHGRTGLLVREGTAEEFAGALRRLISDPEEAEEMGRNGHRHVRDNFGLDAFASRWERTLNETVRRGRERRSRWDRGEDVDDRRVLPIWAELTFELALAYASSSALAWILRALGWIGPTESVGDAVWRMVGWGG